MCSDSSILSNYHNKIYHLKDGDIVKINNDNVKKLNNNSKISFEDNLVSAN